MLQYEDVFTFVLLNRKVIVCLRLKKNEFILNEKLKNVNVEKIYSSLITSVFDVEVMYDCSNAKLMKQKKMSDHHIRPFQK